MDSLTKVYYAPSDQTPSCQSKQQMEDDPDQILEQLLTDICSMKLHRSSSLGAALKKPLLLLLLVSRIENRQIDEDHFDFSDIRRELDTVIRCFGGHPSRSGSRPEQPFSHLRSSDTTSDGTLDHGALSLGARSTRLCRSLWNRRKGSGVVFGQGRFHRFSRWPKTTPDPVVRRAGVHDSSCSWLLFYPF